MSALAALRSPELNFLASPTPSWRPTSALQWLRLIVCSLTLLPLRLAGLLLTFALLVLCSWLGTLCARRGARAREWWRLPFLAGARLCLRLVLALLGFWWVEEAGAPQLSKAEAAVHVCNHLSPFEAIYLKWRLGDCAMLAEQSNFAHPALRLVAEALGIILFDRAAAGDTKHLLARLACDARAPQLLIFPEGCCSNGRALLQFKPGAFMPLERVQPCVAALPAAHTSPCWVSLGPTLPQLLLRLLTSVYSRLAVTFLPPLASSAEERAHGDYMAFAARARAAMAAALRVPTTELCLDDVALGVVATRARVSAEVALVHLHEVQQLVRVTPKEARAVLDIYLAALRRSRSSRGGGGGGGGAGSQPGECGTGERSGFIDFEQFLELLQMLHRETGKFEAAAPSSPPALLRTASVFEPRQDGPREMLRRLYDGLPHDVAGRICFRSFLVALALLNAREQPPPAPAAAAAAAAGEAAAAAEAHSEALALAFQMLDEEGAGRVDVRRLGAVLRMVWPQLPDARVREIFAAAAGGGESITAAAFQAWCAREEVREQLPLFRRAVLGVRGDALALAEARAAAVRAAAAAAAAGKDKSA